jgi:DNA polymerase-3 subunit delta
VAEPKPAYLVSGDDHARIDAWRARLRARDEGAGLESFDARAASPEDVAAALATLSFASGRRFLLVEGVESWRAGALAPLERALADMAPDTTLVLLARGRPPTRIADAVAAAGGESREYAGPKPWEMPRWVAERAAAEGLRLDTEAAKALVAAVGDRRAARLAREVEKLAILAHPRDELSAAEVARIVSGESTAGAYDLADALVDGDRAGALRLAETLQASDDRASRLVFPIVRRLREVHRAAGLVESGASERGVAKALGISPYAAKRTAGRARRADRDALERALCAFADLEVDARAGGGIDEETAFSVTLARAAD